MPKTKKKSKKKSRKSKSGSPTQTPVLSKKELAAKKRATAKKRKEFIQAFISVGSIGAILGLILFFVKDPKLALAGGGGIVVLALSYKYPLSALWGFTIYMPFAGTVTYWIGGGNALFQLAKDGFYIPAMVAMFQGLKRRKQPWVLPKKLKTPLIILLITCLATLLFVNGAQQFSSKPRGNPILMGILGLKVLLGYVPLVTCTYHLLKGKREFLLFIRTHVVLVIVCCLLGVMQYMMLKTGRCQGTDHLLGEDLFKATLDAKCLVGGSLVYSPSQGMIRLPGTLVAPWQWAWFLIGNTFFTFASAFNDPSFKWKVVSFVGLALVFVNAVISGQRIALLLVPVLTVILLVATGKITKLKQFVPIVGGIAILIVGAAVLFPEVIQERIDSTVSRWEASPPTEFIAHQFEFTAKESGGILGNGVGRATNSARVFGQGRLIETYYPKLFYELGPIGVIAFLACVTAITTSTFKAYRSVKDKSLRSYGCALWVFIVFISYQTYYYPLDVDPVAVYYWMVAGAILKLPDIEKQELEKQKEQETPSIEPQKKRRRKRKLSRV
ncbi:MAG: hormogonium polysaccharide biosynthesis protein HpsL [Cyanobacteriota bacterium]|nr:hormogonium polysaccharide biosynthesis protein HpsL [Cyanobacteriota bacterium]